ncbi:hypothetical protein ILYODFUR_036404 [Ilyodon furcidens]|uniref:Uncharacterized protein n=1 Tax=Ilyodon furcidens TaxID=33524 RepID=A0ABV0VLL1_9TELE
MEQRQQNTKCKGGAEKMRDRKKEALQESASTNVNISDLFGRPSHSSGSGISTRNERSDDTAYSSFCENVAEDDPVPDKPIESQRDQILIWGKEKTCLKTIYKNKGNNTMAEDDSAIDRDTTQEEDLDAPQSEIDYFTRPNQRHYTSLFIFTLNRKQTSLQ